MIRRILITLIALVPAGHAFADWELDNGASRLSFVSTKAGEVAEVHHFGKLSGSLADDGSFSLTVDLDSVDTSIPIRDERMRKLLFETGRFPEATVKAQIDMSPLRELAGLSSISPAVPVTFRLTLREEGPPPSAVSQTP